jgi:hypothetical protein
MPSRPQQARHEEGVWCPTPHRSDNRHYVTDGLLIFLNVIGQECSRPSANIHAKFQIETWKVQEPGDAFSFLPLDFRTSFSAEFQEVTWLLSAAKRWCNTLLFARMAAESTYCMAAEHSKACAAKHLISSRWQFHLENYTGFCRRPCGSERDEREPGAPGSLCARITVDF